MRKAVLLIIAAITLFCASVNAQDGKECEVCIGVLEKFTTAVKDKSATNPADMEDIYRAQCKTFEHPKEKRLCWYLGAAADSATNILREVSRPMSVGVPSESICKRVKAKDSSICALRYEGSAVSEPIAPSKPKKKAVKKIDWKNLHKLRVKQLKRLLSDFQIQCEGCVEKEDFVRKLRTQQPKTEL